MARQRVNAKVTAATGRVKHNGIISDITPSPHCLAQTHTPLLRSPPGDESAVWARLPPPSTTLPPSPEPSPPLTPNLPALRAGQTCMAGQGLFSHVPLAPLFFFPSSCALHDLLSQLPQPAKRGNIIQRRPLWRETIYCPPTPRRTSTNTHTFQKRTRERNRGTQV